MAIIPYLLIFVYVFINTTIKLNPSVQGTFKFVKKTAFFLMATKKNQQCKRIKVRVIM